MGINRTPYTKLIKLKENRDYMKTKKAVGGRFGLLGFLSFFSFFAFGSDDFGFFLYSTWGKNIINDFPQN